MFSLDKPYRVVFFKVGMCESLFVSNKNANTNEALGSFSFLQLFTCIYTNFGIDEHLKQLTHY